MAIIDGYYEQEKDRQYSVSAHLLRQLIMTDILGNPYIDNHKKPVSITEIMLFPGEKMKEVKHFSSIEIERIKKAHKWK